MKSKNPFLDLTKFELALWLTSVAVSILSFFMSDSGSVLSLIASLFGVTALIFVAKGYVIGQVLCIVFSVLYGIVSFEQHYYGEMITYLGMSAPMAAFSAIEWLRHPYEGTKEVQVSRLSKRRIAVIAVSTVLVTAVFYFILRALGNASLITSTVSVTTSFLASALIFSRSPYYALAYAANDIVLIVLWVIASIADISYLPMVMCFVMFFANDIYGYISWRRMQRRQKQ